MVSLGKMVQINHVARLTAYEITNIQSGSLAYRALT